MKQDNEKQSLAESVFVLAMTPVAYLSAGYVSAKLWQWHVMSTFPSAPHIGVGAMIGISALLHVFAGGYVNHKQHSDDLGERMIVRVSAIWFCFLVGWLAT